MCTAPTVANHCTRQDLGDRLVVRPLPHIHGMMILTAGRVPDVLLHIPHASTAIPPEHRARFVLDDADLNRELLRVTDWFTDELFELGGVQRLIFGVSRLLVDPERFSDDAQEIMSGRGLGAVYTRTHDGKPLKSAEGRDELLAAFYVPHHRAFNAWAAAALETHGRCLIIDCHSFPMKPMPCDLDPTPDRPDFCIGSDGFHTPSGIVHAAIDAIETLDHEANGKYTVLVNRPYAGSIVPSDYYGRDPRVCSMMIEVNRALYMNEETGERSAGFETCKSDLKQVLESVVEAWAEWRPS